MKFFQKFKKILAAEGGVVADGFILVSTAYGIAHDNGKTATETPHRSLNDKAERLSQAIINCLVLLT